MIKYSFPGSLYFENMRKRFKSNLVLVVVIAKGLYYDYVLYPMVEMTGTS